MIASQKAAANSPYVRLYFLHMFLAAFWRYALAPACSTCRDLAHDRTVLAKCCAGQSSAESSAVARPLYRPGSTIVHLVQCAKKTTTIYFLLALVKSCNV